VSALKQKQKQNQKQKAKPKAKDIKPHSCAVGVGRGSKAALHSGAN